MFSEIRVFMKTPPVEFYTPVSRYPVLGQRSVRGSACERVSHLVILSVTLVLAVVAWACSRSLTRSSGSTTPLVEELGYCDRHPMACPSARSPGTLQTPATSPTATTSQ
jgi:hypothetical protein